MNNENQENLEVNEQIEEENLETKDQIEAEVECINIEEEQFEETENDEVLIGAEEERPKFAKLTKMIKNKFTWYIVGTFVLGLIIGVLCNSNTNQVDQLNHISNLETTITEQDEIISEREGEVADLNAEIDGLNNTVSELEGKVDSAKPWFDMKEEERKALEEESQRKAEEERKALEEEQEKVEKQGYDTGVTYGQLARTPNDYIGEKVKFNGEVIQVLEGGGETQIRLAVGGNYDTVIFCAYDSSIVSSRVLEGDNITIMGLSNGLLTYESTMGGEITVPSVLIEKIDM